MGRFFTVLLGVLLIVMALEIEKYGQVKDLIISITELMVVPLLAPSLWGLFSRRITGRAVWITGLSGFLLGAIIRFGFGEGGWFVDWAAVNDWVVGNKTFLKTFVGVVFPIMILTAIQLMSSGESRGWQDIAKLAARQSKQEEKGEAHSNPIAARVVAWCLAVCSLMMFSLISVNASDSTMVLSIFGGMLAVISVVIFLACRKSSATAKD